MEDLFDNLIYILIVLVGFIISALGKKKKKAAQQRVTSKPQTSAQQKERPFLSNLEKMLNEELGLAEKKYENPYEDEIYEDEQEEILDSPISKLDSIENKLDTVPQELLDDKKDVPYSIEYDDSNEIFNHSITDNEIVEESDIEIIEEFDLKDAIIYSEIINRKEY
jgi:hypothetical protein